MYEEEEIRLELFFNELSLIGNVEKILFKIS